MTARIDDDRPTRYEIVPIKSVAIYSTTPFILSPAVFDVVRYGRSSQPAVLPFTIGNLNGTTAVTSGDVDSTGSNIVFASYSSQARLGARAGDISNTNRTCL